MEQPPEILKSFADRLARLITSENGAEVARLISLSGLFTPEMAASPETATNADKLSVNRPSVERVGIWERKAGESEPVFIRSKAKAEDWHLWANLGRINPKGQRRRILLLGESVARGYLYDPQFTPAKALETILQSQLGKEQVEVIDLARTNLKMDQLRTLADSALALEPDALVIFAGNNWHPSLSSTDDVRFAATVAREVGVRGLKQFAEDRLKSYIEELVKTIATRYQAANIPVVWIVPDYNLVDWRDPEGSAPWLEKGANQQWLNFYNEARSALETEDIDAALSFAGQMAKLDQGTSPTPFYLLAECHKRKQDYGKMRQWLEAARDASIWDRGIHISPRSYTVVQDTLRQQVTKYRQGLVDLPLIFSTYLGGEPADRRLFLDYAHMTADGIRVAMAGTASCLLQFLKGDEMSWERLATHSVMPKPEVEAEAAFLASVHNAHYGQSYDVINFHCSRAVDISPEIAQALSLFIDLQTRRAPYWMCDSAEKLTRLPLPSVHNYLLRSSGKLLDRVLIDAAVNSLKKIGIDARQQVTKLRRQEHSIRRGDVDLLDSYYYTTSPLQRGLMWNPPLNIKTQVTSYYYKAYESISRFCFVGEELVPVELHLTCRIPKDESTEKSVRIEVNGQQVGMVNANHEWQTWQLTVPGTMIRGDVNDVVVHWQQTEFAGEKVMEQAANDIERGHYPELYPVYGEIYTFVAANTLNPR